MCFIKGENEELISLFASACKGSVGRDVYYCRVCMALSVMDVTGIWKHVYVSDLISDLKLVKFSFDFSTFS